MIFLMFHLKLIQMKNKILIHNINKIFLIKINRNIIKNPHLAKFKPKIINFLQVKILLF